MGCVIYLIKVQHQFHELNIGYIKLDTGEQLGISTVVEAFDLLSISRVLLDLFGHLGGHLLGHHSLFYNPLVQ